MHDIPIIKGDFRMSKMLLNNEIFPRVLFVFYSSDLFSKLTSFSSTSNKKEDACFAWHL